MMLMGGDWSECLSTCARGNLPRHKSRVASSARNALTTDRRHHRRCSGRHLGSTLITTQLHGRATHSAYLPHGTMRTAVLFGRQCLRQGLPRPAGSRRAAYASAAGRLFATPRFRSSGSSSSGIRWAGTATGAATGAALSPLALVALGNSEADNGGTTHEEAMLAESRRELAAQVPKALQHSTRYRRGLYHFIEAYFIEPIATGLRFLHLVVLFVPVLVTVPVIWLGARQAHRGNERSGTLWWYGYLVLSMEKAGAAFIKVCLAPSPPLAARLPGSLTVL